MMLLQWWVTGKKTKHRVQSIMEHLSDCSSQSGDMNIEGCGDLLITCSTFFTVITTLIKFHFVNWTAGWSSRQWWISNSTWSSLWEGTDKGKNKKKIFFRALKAKTIWFQQKTVTFIKLWKNFLFCLFKVSLLFEKKWLWSFPYCLCCLCSVC
jgi:hypothetical protein